MRTKPGFDTLSFDDLYNNLRVFERDVKGTTASSSNTQNVAFVFADNTSSMNDVSSTYSVSFPSVLKSQKEGSSSYTDEEESCSLILRIQLVLIRPKWNASIAIKWGILLETAELKGIKTPEEEMLGTMEAKLETMVEDLHIRMIQKLWLPLMERILTVPDILKKLYDEQRDKLGDASVEITAYTLALKKVEAQLLCHQQNQLAYEQKIRLLNIQMSANDKFRLGYGDYRYGSILSYENEVLQSVFMNKESHLEDTSVNDRYADGMHAVPPPMTGNYMPSGPDVEIDYSKCTYGLKQTSVDESDSKPSEYASCESDSSVKTTTSMHALVENTPKVVCEPKVWTDAPIIEEYESDNDNDLVSNVQEDKEKPSFAFTNSLKHVKPSRENVKETGTPNHSLKIKKQDRNGHTRKGLGYALTRKAFFVYDSFSHLIRDCDFHEKRMAKQAELPKSKNKVTGKKEHKPVWNNVQRVNHQNKFVPSALLTKTGKFPVNAARQNCSSQAPSTNTASKDDPHKALKNKGIVDSGCFRYMTRSKAHLANYQEFKGGSMYDKKNKVLFTDTDCLVLSPDFKLPDENQVLLKIPRQHNMYSFNLKNIDPSGDLAFLIAKALIDESNKWHRRLGHKGKQHKASCKAKTVSSINQPLQILHMDLFGPTSDETTPILKDFIRQAKNQFNHKVKTIRSDNRTKFKNNDLIELCGSKGIKREYSNARTPQQNGVAERKNMTLIEAARTILADSFVPTTFWAEAVNTACYVLNKQGFRVYNLENKRVEENLHVNFLENKPNVAGKGHVWMFDLDYLTNYMNYEHVLVDNQANKSAGPKEANNSVGTQANDDQGSNSKEIDLHEEHFVLPIWSAYSTTVKSSRDKIDKHTDFKTCKKPVSQVEQIFLEELEKLKRQEKEAHDAVESPRKEATHDSQNANTNSTNLLDVVSTPISTAGPSRALNDGEPSYLDVPLMPHLEDIYASPKTVEEMKQESRKLGIIKVLYVNDIEELREFFLDCVVTDFSNLETTVNVSPTPTTQIHTIHSKSQILGDPMSAIQTRSKANKNFKAHALEQEDKRGVVVRNKARLVSQGHRKEEGIDYDEVFAPVARIEAIRIFLAFASYIGFIVYQIDVRSAFLYEEFKQHELESYGPKSCETESKNASKHIPNKLKEYLDAPLVKDRMLDNKECSVESHIVVEKKTVVPTIDKVKFVRPKQQEKPVRKPFKYAEMYREDLEVLWSIVKARFNKTKPVDDMDNLLFQTLKIMFEHHVEDNIWKYQQGLAKFLY
uniref:Integrase catalytic domain-containing protein n=1 Tax=Tanacetum cinerariifolium TaxID=118510 RepID=A0A6L2KES9_TANCI|nr:hypothetical protein [Tanacetum cinerariifolium]